MVAEDFVVIASEEDSEVAAVVSEVVLEVAAVHQVGLLAELGREEQHQVVEVGHIPIVIIILDDIITGGLGTGDGGILLGGDTIIGLGIIALYMLGGEWFSQ